MGDLAVAALGDLAAAAFFAVAVPALRVDLAKSASLDCGSRIRVRRVRICIACVERRASPRAVCRRLLPEALMIAEEGAFFLRVFASERPVAMRETAEPRDDVAVLYRVFGLFVVGSAEQRSWSASASECMNGMNRNGRRSSFRPFSKP